MYSPAKKKEGKKGLYDANKTMENSLNSQE